MYYVFGNSNMTCAGMRRGFGKSKTGGWGVFGGDPRGEMAPHFRERS